MPGRYARAGQLASTWAQWVAADQTVRLFETELGSFQTNLKLVELRCRQGGAVASDVFQQRQLVESAQGNLAQALSNRDVLLNSLALLRRSAYVPACTRLMRRAAFLRSGNQSAVDT